jgi:hypothetical protein
MDNPLDPAFLEGPLTEIQKQAHLEAAEAKLGIQLGEVSINHLLHGFGLHNHPIIVPVISFLSEPPRDLRDSASNWLSHLPMRLLRDDKGRSHRIMQAVATGAAPLRADLSYRVARLRNGFSRANSFSMACRALHKKESLR